MPHYENPGAPRPVIALIILSQKCAGARTFPIPQGRQQRAMGDSANRAFPPCVSAVSEGPIRDNVLRGRDQNVEDEGFEAGGI